MAKAVRQTEKHQMNPPHRTTSIGRAPNVCPKNKHKRRSWKKYRGQG